MRLNTYTQRVVVALVLSTAALATVAAGDDNSGKDELRAKGGPLLGLILRPLVDIATAEAASAASGLFSRVIAHFKGADSKPAALAQSSASPSTDGTIPAIAIAVHQLNPQTFQFDRALPVNSGIQTLKTGDVFAVIFTTNVPGQVRVQNIDAKGVVTKLGTYSVLPGRDNRLPRSKGIQLVGDPGRETFNFFFAPCVPTEVAHQAVMQGFVGQLGKCGDEVAHSLQLVTQPAQATPTLRAKAAVNLDLDGADPDVVIAAVPDFRPKDIVTNAISVEHAR